MPATRPAWLLRRLTRSGCD